MLAYPKPQTLNPEHACMHEFEMMMSALFFLNWWRFALSLAIALARSVSLSPPPPSLILSPSLPPSLPLFLPPPPSFSISHGEGESGDLETMRMRSSACKVLT
jgi:hypothetical protein